MDLQLQNKVAFVSGSTAGIGRAIAKCLLKEGAEVIINGRKQADINVTVQELKVETGSVKISGIATDFSKIDEVEDLIGNLPEVDILVNNVGIFEPKPFGEITDEEWFRFFEVNVMSGVRLARHILPSMLKKNWGRILFISSESAVFIPSEMIHYGMTKTAQLAVSRGLAELTRGTRVTVNTILPGPTESRGVGDFVADMAKQEGIDVQEMETRFFNEVRPTSLIQRFADVDEVATTVAYYASPLASATNGAAIRAEGGLIRSIL